VLRDAANRVFCDAAASYRDSPPAGALDDQQARIVVSIGVRVRDAEIQISAVLDTGAPWVLLPSSVAAVVQVAHVAEGVTLVTRWGAVEGRLARYPVTLLADQGESREIDATVFLPTAQPPWPWDAVAILGYSEFLSRIRFAVDPTENKFYFGGD
jgi:hypothetical protein